MRICAKQIKVGPPDLSRYQIEGLCSVVRRMINKKVAYFLSNDVTDPAAIVGFLIYDDEEDMGYFIHEKKIYAVQYDQYYNDNDDDNGILPVISIGPDDCSCVNLLREGGYTIDTNQVTNLHNAIAAWVAKDSTE